MFADQKFNPGLWAVYVRESLLVLGREYQRLLRRGKPEESGKQFFLLFDLIEMLNGRLIVMLLTNCSGEGSSTGKAPSPINHPFNTTRAHICIETS